ncbi:MAG TPA: hypothetical protein VK808_03995 [Bacteroidia bacterium]|nr:hypothetical protein [Bacteroidia bacterium]
MKISTISAALLPFVLLLSVTVQAQFTMPKYKDVEAIKGRQLIVVVSQLDQPFMDKITRKNSTDLMDEYKSFISNYNKNMRTAVAKLWNFNSGEVLYKSAAEVAEIAKDKAQKDKYVVMYCHNLVNKHDFELRIDDSKSDPHITGSVTYFSLALPGDPPFYEILLSLVVPSTREIVFSVATTNFNCNYVHNLKANGDMQAMIKENGHKLSGKTLLILKEEINKDVTGTIGKYYPGVVKLVDYKELLSAVITRDQNSTYAITTQYNLNTGDCTDWIVNCADGATLGHCKSHDSYAGYGKDFFLDMAEFYNGVKK